VAGGCGFPPLGAFYNPAFKFDARNLFWEQLEMVTKIAELEEKAEIEPVQVEDSDDGDEEAVETTGLRFLDAK